MSKVTLWKVVNGVLTSKEFPVTLNPMTEEGWYFTTEQALKGATYRCTSSMCSFQHVYKAPANCPQCGQPGELVS